MLYISYILTAFLLLCVADAKNYVQGKKPNIVLMFADDMGYGDVAFNGHPTTKTPNLDFLSRNGKVMTQWYSGASLCTASRAALMTGRQVPRLGVPNVFMPASKTGLPLNETTIAEHLKTAGYNTAALGKWHLGQREVYLPGARGFDKYLGIPFSDDMGEGRLSKCPDENDRRNPFIKPKCKTKDVRVTAEKYLIKSYNPDDFGPTELYSSNDPGANFVPLVQQEGTTTKVLEQPLDFTTLADKYMEFAQDFISAQTDTDPFFLYVPFSHVHTTTNNLPEEQYASCRFRDKRRRGKFGDAISELDWLAGGILDSINSNGFTNDTLVIFTSDNGPWLVKNESSGALGHFTGTSAGYPNTGKGSTWEGGIREPAVVYWPGMVEPGRSFEVVSSLDVLPTALKLAGLTVPDNIDGKSMLPVILDDEPSQHEFLWHYQIEKSQEGPTAVRYGPYKAHFVTFPGIGNCPWSSDYVKSICKKVEHDPPLLFNVEVDPSEKFQLDPNEYSEVIEAIQHNYEKEVKEMEWNTIIPEPGNGPYAVCCDRSKGCDCDGPPNECGRDDKPTF